MPRCMHGSWVPEKTLNIVKRKFVKSPIGLFSLHAYSSGDKHCKEGPEWLSLLYKACYNNVINITIHHAASTEGEKVTIIKCKKKNTVIFNTRDQNVLGSTTIVTDIDLYHVFRGILKTS